MNGHIKNDKHSAVPFALEHSAINTFLTSMCLAISGLDRRVHYVASASKFSCELSKFDKNH